MKQFHVIYCDGVVAASPAMSCYRTEDSSHNTVGLWDIVSSPQTHIKPKLGDIRNLNIDISYPGRVACGKFLNFQYIASFLGIGGCEFFQ